MTVAGIIIGGTLLALLAWSWSVGALGNPTRLSVVVMLGLVAAAGQLLIPIPSAEPVSAIVLCVAVVLGLRAALVVAAISVIALSTLSGLGPWTPWQVVSYAAGIAVGVALYRMLSVVGDIRVRLAIAVTGSVTVFDVVLTASQYVLFATDTSAAAFTNLAVAGLPLLLFHIAFSVALCWVCGPSLMRALDRARRRTEPVEHSGDHIAIR